MKKNKSPLFLKILPYVNNRYFLSFTGLIVWLSFFDRNDFLTTYNYRKKLQALRNEKLFYEKEITRHTEDLNNLLSNKETMEKYAREKYLMKKDNEEVFLIIEEPKDDKKQN